MLRVASIGLGWWSDELAKAIQGKSGAIRVASCYSRTPEKRKAFAARFGTSAHDSYEAVLADKDIDAVLVTTPHSLHAEHVMQAAASGKHVFVEKPFTLTAASGRAAADACAKAGVVLAVGHNRRHLGAFKEIKRMLAAGELGTVLHAEAHFSAPGALSYTPERWRAKRTESPAGAIAALGIHMIDALCWLLGPVARVSAIAKRRAVPVDIDDTTSALLEFAAGPTGYLGTLFACPWTSTLSVFGTGANAFSQADGTRLVVHRAGADPVEVPVDKVDTLSAELEEFAAACAGSAAYRVTPEEAIHDVAVMEAMVASAANAAAPVRVASPAVAR